MNETLDDAVRRTLRATRERLTAREVAELITQEIDATGVAPFGEMGPETADVERCLRSMGDVEKNEDEYDEHVYGSGDVYGIRGQRYARRN